MCRWSCVLMRLLTQRSVPARLEVASQRVSQPAKTLLLFSVCSARLYHSRPSATLCGCTSTVSIIHRPAAPRKWRGDAHQRPLAPGFNFLTEFRFDLRGDPCYCNTLLDASIHVLYCPISALQQTHKIILL